MARWVRFLIAILVGLAIGLAYGWLVSPVRYIDTSPNTLRIDYKTDYVLMVSETYQSEKDLDQAVRRLGLLGTTSPARAGRPDDPIRPKSRLYRSGYCPHASFDERVADFAAGPGDARPMRRYEERGPWYLLTGLIIGIILGVLYTRYLQPVEYIDTSPALLRQDFKDQYRLLIAVAYSANGDLVRAKARLELLKDPDVFRALSEQAQHSLAENGSSIEARSLGLLAIALGQAPPGPALAVTQAAQTPTSAPSLATPADLNASSPAASGNSDLATPAPPESPASPEGPFTLLNQEKSCDQNLLCPADPDTGYG